jgi:hypothetical protein
VEPPYVYPVDEQPMVEVLVDGSWWPAVLRMRTERADGYHYNAAWTSDGKHGPETRLDTFHQGHVRADTVDRSRGRG